MACLVGAGGEKVPIRAETLPANCRAPYVPSAGEVAGTSRHRHPRRRVPLGKTHLTSTFGQERLRCRNVLKLRSPVVA